MNNKNNSVNMHSMYQNVVTYCPKIANYFKSIETAAFWDYLLQLYFCEQFKFGSIKNLPIEILIDYDDLHCYDKTAIANDRQKIALRKLTNFGWIELSKHENKIKIKINKEYLNK